MATSARRGDTTHPTIKAPRSLTTERWYRNPDTRTADAARSWILRKLRKGSGAAYLQITRDLETLYREHHDACLCEPPLCENTLDDLVAVYLRHPIRGVRNKGLYGSGTSITFPEYQATFQAVLTAAANFVLKHPDNHVDVFAPARTRMNSEQFEHEWLNPLIRREQRALLVSVNRQIGRQSLITGSRVKVTSLLPDELPDDTPTTSDVARRSPFDLWCSITVTHPSGVKEQLIAPVNVKYIGAETRGSTTGGAGMMAWAMTGIRDRQNSVHVFDAMAAQEKEGIGVPDTDYFFLGFSKGLTTRTTDVAWVSSLLGIDPSRGAISYNGSQPFPRLHVDFRRAANTMVPTPTAAEARYRLMSWWEPCEQAEALKRATKAIEARSVAERLARLAGATT